MTTPRVARILVVDDNPATLYSTQRVLRSAGFVTLEATTGRRALELAREQIDLVILDVNLPDIDGFEVCAELRRDERTAHIPVVHLSASYIQETDKLHGLKVGADGYLVHPVEPPELIGTVNAFLRTQRAEDAMRRSEAKFRAVFDEALSGMALVNERFEFIETNPALLRMLGMSREALLGKALFPMLSEPAAGAAAEFRARMAAKKPWKGAIDVLTSSDRVLQLQAVSSLNSVPGVYLAMLYDVTEQAAIETERERLLSAERQARTDAEQANRLKDEFLATLSHELRTPLNAIIGWSQLLRRRDPGSPDTLQALDAIERNARSQAQLIEDLLDVSRITSGKLRLVPETVNVSGAIDAALEAVLPAATARGISLIREYEPPHVTIWGDPARLQQIIWNLVTNAVKFTGRDGHVYVSYSVVDSEVEIRVRDTGRGIRPEFLPHIFERFRQEDASTTRAAGGLGLGLAIVKLLSEMHGGTVTAKSDGEGLGSTFAVRLPLHRTETRAAAAERQAREAGETFGETSLEPSPDALHDIRVLIVDDDADTRTFLSRLLEERHAEVTTAQDVRGALEKVESFDPHVMVSDIGMPERDGYMLIRELRARGYSAAKLPAIALTAFARREDELCALQKGYQRHMSKPVDVNKLISLLAELTLERKAEPTPMAASSG